jgi:catechol 2,3-dioxygenase-like lactoylglutathione lyase family enzyme
VEVLSSRVLIRPRDFEASRRFWCNQVGLRIYREYGTGGRRTGVVLFCGGGFLELTVAGPGPDEAPGPVTLWLQVPDVAVEVARLRQQGVEVGDAETMPWGLKEAWTADPDGVAVVLVEVPEGHPIRTRLE